MKKILVVDDSATVRQQVALALGQAGYDVVHAADGAAGASAIQTRNDLALVICDVNMPNMNGLEMLESVQGRLESSHVPVVMLTTESDPKFIKRAKAAGAKGWLVKPFKPETLISVAKKLAS